MLLFKKCIECYFHVLWSGALFPFCGYVTEPPAVQGPEHHKPMLINTMQYFFPVILRWAKLATDRDPPLTEIVRGTAKLGESSCGSDPPERSSSSPGRRPPSLHDHCVCSGAGQSSPPRHCHRSQAATLHHKKGQPSRRTAAPHQRRS